MTTYTYVPPGCEKTITPFEAYSQNGNGWASRRGAFRTELQLFLKMNLLKIIEFRPPVKSEPYFNIFGEKGVASTNFHPHEARLILAPVNGWDPTDNINQFLGASNE